jgi:uncharacterized protein YecE (DUF72 family)
VSTLSPDPKVQELVACLKQMIKEVTNVIGMSFYQFDSYRKAIDLFSKLEPEAYSMPPSPASIVPLPRQRIVRRPGMLSSQTHTRLMTLSPLIRFGTSTWTYEGWQGTVYRKTYPKGRFKRDCLAEYAAYRYKDALLFRTVGIDHTFYRPVVDQQLQDYAAQVPSDFEMCSKVWERLTIPQFPNLPDYGSKAGQVNPDFLNLDLFLNDVLPPYQRVFAGHTGPFIFEFQRTGIAPDAFYARLDDFLGRLPKDFRYAIEVRNPALLTADYRYLLQKHSAAHVFNHWTYMPALMEQHRRFGGIFSAPFIVFRLLTPLHMQYQQAVKIAEPYNTIVTELPAMRKDTIALVTQAVAENRQVYVLVNNRSEGCAPLTVQALVDQLRQATDVSF